MASVSYLFFFQVMEMDISKQLHAYEVEYHVLQDEMLDAGSLPDDSDRLDKLEKTNAQLKKQNMDLLEKLQVRKRSFKLAFCSAARLPSSYVTFHQHLCQCILGNNSKCLIYSFYIIYQFNIASLREHM